MSECILGKVNETNIAHLSNAIIEIKDTLKMLFVEIKEVKVTMNELKNEQNVFIREIHIHQQDIAEKMAKVETEATLTSKKVTRLNVHKSVHYAMLLVFLSGVWALVGTVVQGMTTPQIHAVSNK